MTSIVITAITLGCTCGGVAAGSVLRRKLPEHHLKDDSKDAIKMGTGLIATLTALLLGLLISSAKSAFDTVDTGAMHVGAEMITLDRLLVQYGSETQEARQLLRRTLATAISRLWPEDKPKLGTFEPIDSLNGIEAINKSVLKLTPQDDAQRSLQSQALQAVAELSHAKWQLLEQTSVSLPIPLLAMLVFWLAVLFVSFGMLAPPNGTSMTILLLCAVSVSGAIFLLCEMARPSEGIMKVSSASLLKAMELLGM